VPRVVPWDSNAIPGKEWPSPESDAESRPALCPPREGSEERSVRPRVRGVPGPHSHSGQALVLRPRVRGGVPGPHSCHGPCACPAIASESPLPGPSPSGESQVPVPGTALIKKCLNGIHSRVPGNASSGAVVRARRKARGQQAHLRGEGRPRVPPLGAPGVLPGNAPCALPSGRVAPCQLKWGPPEQLRVSKLPLCPSPAPAFA